jgi:hypothetical protein
MKNNIYKMGPILHNVELESFTEDKKQITEDKKQITEDKNQFTGWEFTGIMAGIYFFILIIAFVYIWFQNKISYNNIDKYIIKPEDYIIKLENTTNNSK